MRALQEDLEILVHSDPPETWLLRDIEVSGTKRLPMGLPTSFLKMVAAMMKNMVKPMEPLMTSGMKVRLHWKDFS